MSTPDQPANLVPKLHEATTRANFELLMALARSLHELGLPSHRLEEVMLRIANRFNTSLEVFSLPTGLFMTLNGTAAPPLTAVARVQTGAVHLERLARLSEITRRIIRGELGHQQAQAKIDEVMQSPARWGRLATVLAYVLSAASFSVFFGAGLAELGIATCLGVVVGLLSVALQGTGVTRRLFELAAAAAATLVVLAAYRFVGSFVEWIPLASGLIILLPGLALVDAVEELAHGHLASGGARLAGVGVVILAMTFGSVLGGAVLSEQAIAEISEAGVAPTTTVAEPLGIAWLVAALVAVAIGSTIRFRGRVGDIRTALVASTIAIAGARLGSAALGDLAGPFLAAFVLGLAASGFARVTRQPAEMFLVPGLALLVPGSFGVRTMSALLTEQTTVGVDTAFHMFLIAMALVAGLLFSNTLLRTRRLMLPSNVSPGHSNVWRPQ